MRVLVVKLSSIGDLFHAMPAVHGLKVGLGAGIDWVVHKEYVDVVRNFADVDRVIPYYRNSFFSDLVPFLRELRACEYEYVVDLQGLLKSVLVSCLARGRVRIGPSFRRECTDMFYSVIAGKRDKGRHAVDECMDVLRLLNIRDTKIEFPVRFPAMKLDTKRPRIAILPVSRWATKNWPARCYAEVVNSLQESVAPTIYLLGGPDDVAACEEIVRASAGTCINLAGRYSLVETGSLLREMDLLISNDSGPMHMAVALNVPVLAIYGPTDPRRTGPYDARNRVVKTSLACQPCFSRTCRFGDTPCMAGVTPEKVAESAVEMLAKRLKKK